MPLKKLLKLYFLFALLLCILVGCNLTFENPSASSSSTTTGSAESPLNTWIQAAPGVQLRYEQWTSPGDNEDTVTIVRLDVRYIRLSVAYQPTNPLTMSDWMKKEQATAIINGGYFDEQNNAEGLVVSNGQVYGSSYSGFGGMLSVNRQGQISLRSLSEEPYNPGSEQLEQATQSSPLLMLHGKRTQFEANAASTRRSVVAMDKQGRLLFIVSPGMAFSLDELADLLVSSDLSIDTALNLDGGASTGLYVNAGSQHVSIDSVTPLPIVIVVKTK
ncbi:MAG TPA: phosphodiester glycosidase family protein [Ktedonobacteraceae bacterium]|nr:phosphodiester glycosidase family protein [Ktedonobacteraceae bacterium]